MARAWLARENVPSGCYARTASSWRHSASSRQSIPPSFEQIRRRYAVTDPGADWPKYLDLDRWIGVNIRRIRQLELDVARPKRILDLGCGAGYFLYIAQLTGPFWSWPRHGSPGNVRGNHAPARCPPRRSANPSVSSAPKLRTKIRCHYRLHDLLQQSQDARPLGGPGVGIFSQ